MCSYIISALNLHVQHFFNNKIEETKNNKIADILSGVGKHVLTCLYTRDQAYTNIYKHMAGV